MSVFDTFQSKAYPHHFSASLTVRQIAGGTPSNPKIAEGWLRTKWRDDDDLIRQAVAEVMTERGINEEEAARIVSDKRHLNGFKRAETGELYLDGRCLKAAIKEAANIRWAKDRWGPSNKGTIGFFAEHFFVKEERLGLGVIEPSRIEQMFIHKYTGSAIQYVEVVAEATVDFTIMCDYALTDEQWALLWLTGEQQGIGSSRSQGFGKYEVTRWDKVKVPKATRELVMSNGQNAGGDLA